MIIKNVQNKHILSATYFCDGGGGGYISMYCDNFTSEDWARTNIFHWKMTLKLYSFFLENLYSKHK